MCLQQIKAYRFVKDYKPRSWNCEKKAKKDMHCLFPANGNLPWLWWQVDYSGGGNPICDKSAAKSAPFEVDFPLHVCNSADPLWIRNVWTYPKSSTVLKKSQSKHLYWQNATFKCIDKIKGTFRVHSHVVDPQQIFHRKSSVNQLRFFGVKSAA